jgi:predicted transcriptional regulator
MKSGILVLALLMLALVAIPLAPYSGSSGTAAPSGDANGAGFAYRNGAGMAGPLSPAGAGMMRGDHGALPEAAGTRHRHGRPAESRVQDELRRDPSDWSLPVRAVRFRGYRRLSGKNILDHEKRHLIYTTVLLNPGIGIPALASQTGINLHTLRYHLGYLMQHKKIACIEQGGGCHFFENHGKYNAEDQQKILYQRYPTTSRILSLVATQPGITRGEIAAELGLAGPSVTRWTHRLIAGGVVSEVRDGRCVHYYPAGGTGGIAA